MIQTSILSIRWLVLVFASLTLIGHKLRAEDLFFIDTSFENASQLYWDPVSGGKTQVYLLYDHERESPNRAAGHWHFRVEAKPNSKVTLVLNHFQNVWNGKVGIPVSDRTICFVSEDATDWESIETDLLPDKDCIELTLEIPKSGSLYVARLPPYRLSDLDQLIAEIVSHPMVQVTELGRTVQDRRLELIRIGKLDAPFRIFLRARAHPWESGGNWVLEGMIRQLLADDAQSRKYLDKFCVYVLPIANKDGVAAGKTRFNLRGKDLNRNWDQPADPELCPENYALENWVQRMIANGLKPHLAIELHNDENGQLHVSRPHGVDTTGYLERMGRLEILLREKTWFREGSTGSTFTNAGTLGEGWLVRYQIDSVVHELNANWVEGLQSHASSAHWQLYGRQLCDVFFDFFPNADRLNVSDNK